MSKRSIDGESAHPKVVARLELIGRALGNARKQQNLTRRQLSERVGVTEQTLARVERGDTTVRIATVLEIMQALGLLNELSPQPSERLLDSSHLGERVRHAASDKDFF